MGLFKTLGIGALTGGGGLAQLGALVGTASASKSLASSFGGEDFRFSPNVQQLESDIQNVRSIGTTPVDKVSASGQIQLDNLAAQRQQTLDSIQASSPAQINKARQQLALTGGLQTGSTERFQREQGRDIQGLGQLVKGDAQRTASDITAADLEQAEGFKDQALLTTPLLSGGVASLQNKAAAGNARAEELAKGDALSRIAGGGAGLASNILGGVGGIFS